MNELHLERPGIDERLAVAGNTSAMKPTRASAEDGGAIGPLELVTAAGWTARTKRGLLGRALMALESEWDGAEQPRAPREHDINALALTMPMEIKPEDGRPGWRTTAKERLSMARAHAHDWYEAERTRTISRLRTLALAQKSLALVILDLGIDRPEARAMAMLSWWLDHRCPCCMGTKLDPLPSGGRGAARACKKCGGTGERQLPNEQHGRVIERQMIDSRMAALQKLRKFTSGLPHHRT